MSVRCDCASLVPLLVFSQPQSATKSSGSSKPVKRSQLEHIIRAAAGNADTMEIIVIGSQAIMATYPDAPDDLLVSIEADVFPKDKPSDSILIDGAIGERSMFHETFGYDAHGVDETTAVLPAGWKERLVPIRNENTRGVTGWCLEVHDLAVSKLAAGREKDFAYLTALFRHGLASPAIVRERLSMTTFANEAMRKTIEDRLTRLVGS